MLVLMKCPNCNADLQMEETREYMFCQYCGTKVANMQQKVQVVNHIQIDAASLFPHLQMQNRYGIPQIGLLLGKIQEMKRIGNIDQAIAYCDAVLVLDPNNQEVLRERDLMLKTITNPNVFVRFTSVNQNAGLQTSIDNRQITRYMIGEEKRFTLPLGRHIIKFRSGMKRYAREFEIYDRNSIARFTFTVGRYSNEIYTA